jgi:hypothetical protein
MGCWIVQSSALAVVDNHYKELGILAHEHCAMDGVRTQSFQVEHLAKGDRKMTTITKLKAALDLVDAQWKCSRLWSMEEAQDVAEGLLSVIAEMESAEPVGHVYTIAGVQHVTMTEPVEDGPLFAQPKSEPDAVAWAISRWIAEVANRPLKNVHRRSLDDTWRQVIRHFGGDDTKILPLKRHDDLVADDIQNSRANDAIAQPKAEPAAAPQAKPLTDEQIDDLAGAAFDDHAWRGTTILNREVARAVERAHGIGGEHD